MHLVSGDMLWTNVDPIPYQYPSLIKDLKTDVLIIGGGITGALAAYYLSKAGYETTLVEKNMIALGSTKASTSILQYEIDLDFLGLKGLIGEDNTANCFRLCHDTVYEIHRVVKDIKAQCDFALKDCFYYTDNSSEVKSLKKEYDIRKKHGFHVEFITKEMAKNMFSFSVEAGIYSTSGAAQINPFRFAHELIHYATTHFNLKVYENCDVRDIHPHDQGVHLLTTNDIKIDCNKVVVAQGYESTKLINRSIAKFTRTFTLVTKPVTSFKGWHNTCIVRDNKDPYTYFRVTGDNRIIFGGEDESIGNWDSKMATLTNKDKAAKEIYGRLEKKLKNYFPHITDIDVEYRFSGLFGVTKDGLPIVGNDPSLPNCYFSLGYGSNGIIYAVIGAQILKELFEGKKSPYLSLFGFNR